MPSLRESFELALADIRTETPNAPLIAGPSTAGTRPPRLWLPIAAQQWAQRARARVLDGINLANCRLPTPERSMLHFTEGDVVQSTSLYLLHPVNKALSERNRDVICCWESRANHSRCDVVWRRGPERRPFAALELKRRRTINLNQFERAKTTPAAFERDLNRAYTLDEETLFEGNALVLMQTMVHYSHWYGIHHVAVFDWDNLFLSVIDPQGADGGEYVLGTAIPRTSAQNIVSKCLLGFLERVYHFHKHHQVMNLRTYEV